MKVLVIVSGCVWPILLNTVAGVRGVDECWTTPAASSDTAARAGLRAASPQIVTGADRRCRSASS